MLDFCGPTRQGCLLESSMYMWWPLQGKYSCTGQDDWLMSTVAVLLHPPSMALHMGQGRSDAAAVDSV